MSGEDATGGEGTVTLAAVFRVLRDVQAEQREQRTDVRDIRSVLLAQVEQGRRLERRIEDLDRRLGELERRLGELRQQISDVDRHVSEQRDELELIIRSELMGQLGHLRVQLDPRLDELEDRIAELERNARLAP